VKSQNMVPPAEAQAGFIKLGQRRGCGPALESSSAHWLSRLRQRPSCEPSLLTTRRARNERTDSRAGGAENPAQCTSVALRKSAAGFHGRPAIVAAAVMLGISVAPLAVGSAGFWGEIIFVPTAHAQSMMQHILTRLRGERLSPGIVKSNGRIEATQVDISSKYPGRLAEVSVEEGSDVTQGQVVAKISSPEYEARLRAAEADVQRTKDALATAEADINARQSTLDFAKSDFIRAQELIKRGTIAMQTWEQRKRNYQAADASLKAVTAKRDQAQSAIKNAEAQVERIQSVLHDLTLVSPRLGRVQYQLARGGEVVAAGTPILTILDLTDVYMTIFLPGADAAKLEIGGEARIVLDAVPDYVIPATVNFVAADAQFTPKTVETKDERAKLMFRVKLKIDPQVLKEYYKKIKTGVRGIGIVRTSAVTAWPSDLQVKLPDAR
jgi:HlyD family secretion protein